MIERCPHPQDTSRDGQTIKVRDRGCEVTLTAARAYELLLGRNRGPAAVVAPEVHNRQRFGSPDDARTGHAASWTNNTGGGSLRHINSPLLLDARGARKDSSRLDRAALLLRYFFSEHQASVAGSSVANTA